METTLKLTADEVLALPFDGKQYQLIEGDLHMSPVPRPWHQILLFRIAKAIDNHLDEGRVRGHVFVSPIDVRLDADNVFQPDVLLVLEARKAIVHEECITGAPDLCAEILSPSNRDFDLHAKRAVYARSGVTEYWIVDPEAKTVSIYSLQIDATRPVAVFTDAGIVTSPLLPGFAYSAGELFKRD